MPDGVAAPLGQVQISGIWLAGEVEVIGDACCVQIIDSTLIPGVAKCRAKRLSGEPSINGSATGPAFA